ncbi:MAG: 2-C-methyl-D-erythritol 2,4-cyclodiphosphate synthase [Chloroflexi bacterium]|nr:2-C-methyl-D-erythritol 2,4-cyclodiphosphate synthase [Chloroflexota bacterium]
MRVGLGYDIHKLVEGRKLVLGGVDIPYHLGLMGESDADVLVHAIIDALLGAASLGDIGHHFPPGDSRYRRASSIELLRTIVNKLRENRVKIANIDATVVLEGPRLSPFIDQMRYRIASAGDMSPDQVNIKATTSQGIGPVGSKEAIAAFAVALVLRARLVVAEG